MLVLDDRNQFIFDEKLRLKLEEVLVDIVVEEKKQIERGWVKPKVSIEDGKISIDLEINAPGKNTYDDHKITMEEFKAGRSAEDVFIDKVIEKMLDMLPDLTEEVEKELGV